METNKNTPNSQLILFIAIIVIAFIVYKFLKPYFIKYDTTILFCGGLGSGKTLNSVKTALKMYKKNIFKWKIKRKWIKTTNKIKQINYKIKTKIFKSKKAKTPILKIIPEKPLFYSTIPIQINKKTQSIKLTKEHLILKKRINQNSIVLIDELPNIVNQFNWNIEIVQNNLNEFITYFRHYINGYLIINGQAVSEIVKQVRVKLNSYYWCYNFQKFLFIFYRVRILNNQISENQVSLSSEFIEDHTKWTYGILPFKKYNSRAYKHRYDKLIASDNTNFNSKDLTTNKIIRFDTRLSELDDDYKEQKAIQDKRKQEYYNNKK